VSKSKYLIVRFTPNQHDLLSKIAKAKGQSISATIRDSTLKGLISEEIVAIVGKEELAKALNIDPVLLDYFLSKNRTLPKGSEKV